MAERTDQLLQEIQQATQVRYLSDLICNSFTKDAKALISQIPNDRYTIEEWNEAASYICSENCLCKTVEAVKKEILKHR